MKGCEIDINSSRLLIGNAVGASLSVGFPYRHNRGTPDGHVFEALEGSGVINTNVNMIRECRCARFITKRPKADTGDDCLYLGEVALPIAFAPIGAVWKCTQP